MTPPRGTTPAPSIAPAPTWARVATVATAAAIGTLVVAAPVGAHTGLADGGAVDGVVHPVLGPDHLLAMVAVGVLAAMSTRGGSAWRTPLGFVAGMVAGGLAGLAGLALPGGEALIAASVLILGVGIATVARGDARWLPLAAVALGAVHGVAHGAEMPAGALPAAYLAGFVGTTAALHLSGALIGVGLRGRATARLATGALVAGAGAALLLGG